MRPFTRLHQNFLFSCPFLSIWCIMKWFWDRSNIFVSYLYLPYFISFAKTSHFFPPLSRRRDNRNLINYKSFIYQSIFIQEQMTENPRVGGSNPPPRHQVPTIRFHKSLMCKHIVQCVLREQTILCLLITTIDLFL